MKLSSKTVALLGALAFAGSASAQTVVHISGATTYRACVHQAICEILDSGFTFNCDNTNAYKAGAAVYVGKLNQGNPATDPSVVIKTYWTGSLAGVYDVSKPNAIASHYIDQNNVTLVTHNGFNAQGVPTFGAAYGLAAGFATEASAAPDVCLTDAFQSSCATAIGTAATGGAAAKTAIKAVTLKAAGTAAKAGGKGAVGLVAFQWVVGRTSATQANVTNISQQNALTLATGGMVPVAQLNGLGGADLNKYLLQVGRNEDSGTRINAHAEANNGFGKPVIQFALSFSGSTSNQADGRQTGGAGSTVTSFDLWPASAPLNTAPGINWNTDGHSGYIGGGDVKAVLQSTNPADLTVLTDTAGALSGFTTPATHAFFIGYLGTADAAVGGGAIQLNYNGVPFTVGNVQNGTYSLWGYEHMYYLPAFSGTGKAVADAIADQLFTTDADVNNNNGTGAISVHGTSGTVLQSGILLDANVVVSKPVEGGIITQTY
jgi:hypothetical protein